MLDLLFRLRDIGPRLMLVTLPTFVAAFVLTLWPRRASVITAAILYTLGTLATFGPPAASFLAVTWLNVRMAEGESSSSHGDVLFLGVVLSACMLGYAIVAAILLWPGVSHRKAMRWGKILQLVCLPPLACFVAAFSERSHWLWSDALRWLVYALLWFRIRESYPSVLAPPSSEPAG